MRRKDESAYKPGSVKDDHSSGTCVTAGLKQPTRIHCGSQYQIPIWPCSKRGLPCRKLLPVARCALTAPFQPYRQRSCLGGIFSVALSVGSRPPGVTWRFTLWSPDFPPHLAEERSPSRLNCKNNQYSSEPQALPAIFSAAHPDRIGKAGSF